MYVLEVKDLTVTYRNEERVVRAVDNVSLKIRKGEVLSLVGESGSGKTTLGLAIIKLLPPGTVLKGSIMFNGKDLIKLSNDELRDIRGNKISMIFQEPMTALNPAFTIGYFMTDVLSRKLKISEKAAKNIVIESLRKVKIPDPETLLKRYPHELSGGMRQRVLIALALTTNPELLIADEPTSALDVSVQAQILRLLKDLQREYRTTTIFITHNLGVAAQISDRLAVMYAGKIVELGYVKDIFRRPLHPYTEALLRAVPRLGSKRVEIEPIPGQVPDLANPPKGCRFHPRCPYAEEICKVKEPLLKDLGDRHIACWLR
ncbi:MAG: peptide ABC transporter ATP-binding protein [Thermoprotei archaeon]|nr:MAG: peptide ABC transporter ATP-binding protein [Thermoprotei archaeon]